MNTLCYCCCACLIFYWFCFVFIVVRDSLCFNFLFEYETFLSISRRRRCCRYCRSSLPKKKYTSTYILHYLYIDKHTNSYILYTFIYIYAFIYIFISLFLFLFFYLTKVFFCIKRGEDCLVGDEAEWERERGELFAVFVQMCVLIP